MDTHYDILPMDEVGSTQDVAGRACRGAGRTVLVIADRQVNGRGRGGRGWLEPDVGMFASLAFVPEWEDEEFPRIPLTAAVAIRRSVTSGTGVTPDLKWPNDLLVDGRKVGGILVEASDGVVTVGCGVNLWWRDPPEFAAAVCTGIIDRGLAMRIATTWADEMLSWMCGPPERWPEGEYRDACITIGRRVRWDGGAGLASGIDDTGALIVVDRDGDHRVLSGDVHLLTDG